MTGYRRSVWQVIAIAAFAATAALAVTLTRPQPIVSVAAASACRATGMYAWLGAAAASGTVRQVAAATEKASADAVYALEFTNISGRACSLDGYPGVWAYTGGRQIGSPASLDPSVRPSTVTLAPHATAHAVLRYTLTASFSASACAQVTVRELRVYLPHAGGTLLVPLTIPACSRKGPDFLSVQAVQPRAGIPGFPHY